MTEDHDTGTSLATESGIKLDSPDMYKVILLNDHYTPMDFVVEVLRKIFHKNPAEATKIMLEVHKKGKGIAGVYIYDIAATKIEQVKGMAKHDEYPLRCTIERA